MEEKLVNILNEMAEYLNISQMKKLQEVLLKNMKEQEESISETTNYDYLEMFIAAKKIEGCSDRTVTYYKATVEHLLKSIDTPIRKMTTARRFQTDSLIGENRSHILKGFSFGGFLHGVAVNCADIKKRTELFLLGLNPLISF